MTIVNVTMVTITVDDDYGEDDNHIITVATMTLVTMTIVTIEMVTITESNDKIQT